MMTCSVRRIGGGLAAALLAAAALSATTPQPARADAAGRGGDYVALDSPATALDTRTGVGGAAGPLVGGATRTVPVAGRVGVPAAGVSAVLVDVSAVQPTLGTYLRLWGDGTPAPALSMVNVDAGKTVSNTAAVPLGANGRVTVWNSAGAVHVVLDVLGYFLAAPGAGTDRGGFVPVPDTRIVDTRSTPGTTALPPGGRLTVTVGTGAPVPATAGAAFVNITVTGAATGGWLGAHPGTTPGPGSIVDFGAGTTAVGTAVKLSAGKVTFNNGGGSAIHLIVDVHGFVPAQAREGAGLRTLTATRLVDTRPADAPVPAHGTLDVPVGGTNGLPTRGIAGALLNLTVVGPRSPGLLDAWPADRPRPGLSLLNFPAGSTRASFAVVRPGGDGTVRILNDSASPLHLLVDLQGWFAEPVTPLPTVPYTATSAVQVPPDIDNGVGAIEYAYVDNAGRLVQGHQENPDVASSVRWEVISDNEQFTGQPALAAQADGRLDVTGQRAEADVWTRTQVPRPGTGWLPWMGVGASLVAAPTAGRLPDGTLVLFGADADGRLWRLAQSGPNAAFGSWASLGDVDLAGAPTIAAGRDGLQLIARTTAGTVRMATYYPWGQLSEWTDLGGTAVTGTPAVVGLPGFKLRIFVRMADGTVETKGQDSSGAFPAAWTPLPGLAATGSPSAVLSPVNSRITVLARGADEIVYYSDETGQATGAFGAWKAGTVDRPTATDPTAFTFTTSRGPIWGFVTRSADNQHTLWVVNPDAVSARTVSAAFSARPLPAAPR